MKELMIERLRKIEDLEQRQLLKDIVSGVFVNLIDYQDDMNKKLGDRVFFLNQLVASGISIHE